MRASESCLCHFLLLKFVSQMFLLAASGLNCPSSQDLFRFILSWTRRSVLSGLQSLAYSLRLCRVLRICQCHCCEYACPGWAARPSWNSFGRVGHYCLCSAAHSPTGQLPGFQSASCRPREQCRSYLHSTMCSMLYLRCGMMSYLLSMADGCSISLSLSSE
jgi:hypothetical protein